MVELLGKDVKAGILKYILDFQIYMLMQGLPGSSTNTWQKLSFKVQQDRWGVVSKADFVKK